MKEQLSQELDQVLRTLREFQDQLLEDSPDWRCLKVPTIGDLEETIGDIKRIKMQYCGPSSFEYGDEHEPF